AQPVPRLREALEAALERGPELPVGRPAVRDERRVGAAGLVRLWLFSGRLRRDVGNPARVRQLRDRTARNAEGRTPDDVQRVVARREVAVAVRDERRLDGPADLGRVPA